MLQSECESSSSVRSLLRFQIFHRLLPQDGINSHTLELIKNFAIYKNDNLKIVTRKYCITPTSRGYDCG